VPGHAGHEARQFGNIVGHVKGVDDMGSLGAWTAEQFDPRLNWGDVEWIKKRWGGKLILKGIQDVEDARLAADSGRRRADRQQPRRAPARRRAVSIARCRPSSPRWAAQIEVHMDGGIRSGQDVLKAWALGARGTYIGRAFLYGLGAMGEAGVTKALEIIHKELDLTMAFCGHTWVRGVDRRRHTAAGSSSCPRRWCSRISITRRAKSVGNSCVCVIAMDQGSDSRRRPWLLCSRRI
jgi:L-lactate dehydrogenase (cytochrome)